MYTYINLFVFRRKMIVVSDALQLYNLFLKYIFTGPESATHPETDMNLSPGLLNWYTVYDIL